MTRRSFILDETVAESGKGHLKLNKPVLAQEKGIIRRSSSTITCICFGRCFLVETMKRYGLIVVEEVKVVKQGNIKNLWLQKPWALLHYQAAMRLQE
jgi:hypothetical protein